MRSPHGSTPETHHFLANSRTEALFVTLLFTPARFAGGDEIAGQRSLI